jgi:hypothetical protein
LFHADIAEQIDLLIALGHQWESIKDYTIPQMQTFLLLGVRRKVSEMRDSAVMLRTAYHAEPRDFKKHLKQLDENG